MTTRKAKKVEVAVVDTKLVSLEDQMSQPVEVINEPVVDNENLREELEVQAQKLKEELKEVNNKLKSLRMKDRKGTQGESKMDKAKAVMDQMKGSERKDILKVFMEQCDLSKAAASTYYQVLKKKM